MCTSTQQMAFTDIGDIAAQVWTQVFREPIVREAEKRVGESGLRLDLGVCGVWQPQAVALLDFKVIYADAPSYSNRLPESVYESGSQDIKRIYKQAVEDRRGTFTPFVTSVDGLTSSSGSKVLSLREWPHVLQANGKSLKHKHVATSEQSFCLPSSEQPASPKGFQSKVEKWSGLGGWGLSVLNHELK